MTGKIDPLFANHPEVVSQEQQTKDFMATLRFEQSAMGSTLIKSTKEMRDRCRELSKPDQDDYDRAVICIIDDLEALLSVMR
jgi:hypothetical protein